MKNELEGAFSSHRDELVDTIKEHGFSVDWDTEEMTSFSDDDDNEYIVTWGSSGGTYWPVRIESRSQDDDDDDE